MSHSLDIPTLFNVQGKIVLITGGGSGIGKMIAAGFVRNGARVYIAARKEAQLKEAVGDLQKFQPPPVKGMWGCDALIAEFKRRETRLHVLVNNSGTSWGAPFDEFPEKGWDNVFNVNVKSVFYLTAGLTEYICKDASALDPGRVINISSTGSVDPHSEGPVSDKGNGVWSYLPSKAAVNHLTSQLAVKLAPRYVTVNAILPGSFPSKMTAFGFKNFEDQLVGSQPMGKVGTTADMAGLALFLAAPASAHITGAHIVIDGGARITKGSRL
ncbi:hypothetical protein FB45DRAFT_875321 [Roridomyces roridus]|uniref:Uncharacterized protein n=1 Tax=Roridomyces roridus TaxID=1738132 RepID=A0AAD7B728_9AGAR|nr:hypothetical protein FB45DRAFT_875321 [Roridomyces roridus]